MIRLAALCLALSLPAAAEAELRFCNETPLPVSVAIGYSDDGVWTSEGWWTAGPGDCTVPVGGDLPLRYYYWRATVEGAAFPTGDYYFCTSPEAFTIRGDTDCAARGYDRNAFAELDIGEAPSWTVTLDAAAFGRPLPEAAPPAPDPADGEPYTAHGLLSHCELSEEGVACELHGPDGWRYLASSATGTDEALLMEIFRLPANTPAEVSGRMRGYSGVTVDVTFETWRRAGSDPFAGIRDALQGLWISTAREDHAIAITGGLYEELIRDRTEARAIMLLAERCGDSFGGAGPVMLLRYFSAPDAYDCRLIVAAGDGSLSTRRAGAAGEDEFVLLTLDEMLE